MSPGARASLRAGPPPPGPVGGGRRLARRAPPPAPPSLGRSPHGLGRVPAPVPTSRAGEAPGRALDSLRHRPRASPAGHPMPRRARSHRLLSASRLLPVYSRRLLPPRDTHLRSNTQTHSGDSWGPEEPARSGDPPLPAPTLPLPPPAGRVLEWWGLCCCPGVSGLGVPRRQDGEALHEAGRTPGWGLRAGVSVPGQFPGFPRRGGDSEAPWVPPGRQAPWQPGSACVAASPALSHFSDTGAHNLLALFLSFPPASSHGGRGATRCALPPRPTVPKALLVRSALALQRGLNPPAVGTAGGPRERRRGGDDRFSAPQFPFTAYWDV